MELELREYIAPARKWWWLIVATTFVAALSSYLATRQQVPVYRSTTTIMVGSAIDDPNPTSAQFSTTRQLAATYVDIAGRASVRSSAAEALGLAELTEDIVVRRLNDTNLIDIVVTDIDPRRAQAVAAELVRQLILRSPAGQEDEDQQFVNQLLQSYQAQITETQRQIAAKQEELGQAIGAREIADIQAEIEQMESALRTLSTDYANLRSSTQQGATNTIRVIEPASLPRKPVEPNHAITIMTAAGIGLVLSISAAYVLEYLDDTVRTPELLTRLTQLPTLAGIAEIKTPGDDKLVTINQPRSPASEAFRVLRTAIQYAWIDESNQIILVTSAAPGEGKSTISSNLAVVLAQAGPRVLLVDTDLRRPALHSIFGLSNKRGLTSMLLRYKGDEDDDGLDSLVENMVQETVVEGLQLLACGPLPPNPSELLGSNKMRKVLDVLTDRYDFIILDSSPVLSVTDAAVLGAQANGTLLVVRSGRSRKEAVRQAAERFRELNARILGSVLNGVELREGAYGIYYYEEPDHVESNKPVLAHAEDNVVKKLRKRFLGRQAT